MKIVPKTLTGTLHNLNKGACDWGWQGLLAYGCQNCVVVLDPKTVQVIQTLDKHKGYVVKVKWSLENYHHDIASPYTLRLASADYNGRIIVWDIGQASIRAEFSDGSKPIADMEWLSFQDTSHDLLAVLHPPYSLVVWNAATGTKLWKKSYTESLTSFSFDPFQLSRLAFLGQDCILFVDDFTISKAPSSNGKKYYISSPTSQSSSMSHSTSAEKIGDKKGQKQTLGRRVTNILVGETNKRPQDGDSASLNECLQLCFQRACRHHLVLLYQREILILDLDINQTVGIIPMERTGSPFAQVIPLQQRDVFMCLHDNGTVTVRVRRRQNHSSPTVGGAAEPEMTTGSTQMDVAYDLRCQSDPLRITRHSRVYGACCCPVTENKVALIMTDSRVLVWELKTYDYPGPGNSYFPQSPLFTPGPPIADRVQALGSLPESTSVKLGIISNPSQLVPKTALAELIGHTQAFVQESNSVQKHGVLLKFVLTGLLSGVAAPPLVMRMCPPLTTKNWAVYQPLLAVGTSTGVIQVFNISSCLLVKEVNIHSCTIRGVEWVSLHSFLSYAHPGSGGNGLVRNELMLTDIQTGKSVPFRPPRDEEAPIEAVKVSYLKQYFVVLFKDKPFELWDLRSGTLLRQMPKNFPQVTALEWSPAHLTKSVKKKSSMTDSSTTLDMSGSSSAVMDPVSRDGKPGGGTSAVREHFVFTDTNGLLYHFILEGNMLKDGSKIPPDGSMGSITSIAWKAETLVLSDVDGNINLWDLKARVSRAVPTHRGWIRKIKFAPGRGNMKLLVLYGDGVDVWDTKEVERVSSVKCPKDMAKISDVDWAASDRPVLACADGIIRVMDTNFMIGSSPMEEGQLTDAIFSPHLLAPKVALTLKYVLQHQPWNTDYQLHLQETEENADTARLINEQLQLIDSEIKDYLPNCHFGTAQRSLITARLFGDQSEVTFWTVALYYLRAEKAQPMSKRIPRSASNLSTGDLFVPSTPAKETSNLLMLDEGEAGKADDHIDWSFLKDNPLETCFDMLCDADTFQKYQLERIGIHDSKRSTYEHTRKCAEMLIYLGETDRAVQLLLETEPNNEQYYNDCLQACLVASIRSSGASQSTIKLVATNLIASGKLAEGVQLLCLIDKGLDSCRYLQDYGQWDEAAWLAKATLDYVECSEISRRWCDYLCSPQVNLKSRAVLVMLSLGQFTKVLELLYSMRHFDRATLFVEACKEFGLLDESQETLSLVESIYLEYARYLLHLGNRPVCEFYCKLAGEKGSQLLNDINSSVYN